MALKLRIISDHYKALGKRSSRLFGVHGGRIGRARDNDWILPDPERYVSSHHCKVQFRAGQWILEDTSTNGVFINGSNAPVSVEGPYLLQDGDRLRIGDYEILVSIDERNDFPPDASGQLPAQGPLTRGPFGEDLGENLDITDLLSDKLKRGSTKEAHTEAFNHALKAAHSAAQPAAQTLQDSGAVSLLDDIDEVDPLPAAPNKRPSDWDTATRPWDRRTMTPVPPSAVISRNEPERPRRTSDVNGELQAGVEAFCRGLGIDPTAMPIDTQATLLTLAGQIFREVILGLMEALKNRADLKSRLRLNQTMIGPMENNPLKFSTSVDEAVLKLLDPHGHRYLGPVEAIRDSFADLKQHQLALGAAVQAAVDEFMNRIEPNELQERFDRGLKRGPLLGAANKTKYWDLYVEFYQVLNQRNEQGLPTVFAEELARTYADKLSQQPKNKKR